jgi:hypothetical protein
MKAKNQDEKRISWR